MDIPSESAVALLTFLLPGFISAAILYALTPNPRPSPFESTVLALIFTILVQAGVVIVREAFLLVGRLWAFGIWNEDSRLVSSVLFAGVLGLLLAYWRNHDTIHRLLRRMGITLQTSYASEWYGALFTNTQFVVLHLKGDRRLYGWADRWPSEPTSGHFVISQPQWLTDGAPIDLAQVSTMLVASADVEMVEFVKATP